MLTNRATLSGPGLCQWHHHDHDVTLMVLDFGRVINLTWPSDSVTWADDSDTGGACVGLGPGMSSASQQGPGAGGGQKAGQSRFEWLHKQVTTLMVSSLGSNCIMMCSTASSNK